MKHLIFILKHNYLCCLAFLLILLLGCNREGNHKADNQSEIAKYRQEIVEQVNLLDVNRSDYDEKMQEAIIKLKKTVKNGERDKFVYLNIAKVYLKMGRFSDAIAALDDFAKHNKPYPELYLYYGFIYEKMGDGKKAAVNYKKALTLLSENIKKNNNVNSQLNRIFAICFVEGKKAAIDELRKLIVNNPDTQEYQSFLSVIKDFSREEFLNNLQ